MSTTLTATITGDTPASVVLTAVTRNDTGASPSLSPVLPQAMSAGGGGVYSYAITDPAGDCLSGYTYTFAIHWADGSIQSVTLVSAGPASLPAYQSIAAANALAASLPASLLGAYLAANDAAKASALVQATNDIDRGMRYQGRRFCHKQPFEFPRLAYGPMLASAEYDWGWWAGLENLGDFSRDVWDWDFQNSVAVIPPAVLQAHLYQTNFILAGGDPRQDDIHGGIKSQSNAGLSETYDREAPGADTGLCQRAWRLLRPYKLVSGRLL